MAQEKVKQQSVRDYFRAVWAKPKNQAHTVAHAKKYITPFFLILLTFSVVRVANPFGVRDTISGLWIGLSAAQFGAVIYSISLFATLANPPIPPASAEVSKRGKRVAIIIMLTILYANAFSPYIYEWIVSLINQY